MKPAQRDRFLRIAFGITAKEWDIVLEYQRGRCAICDKSIRTKPRPHSDHDHHSGLFRGLLCGQCNRALGRAQDKRWGWTPVCFLKAFLYLLNPPSVRALKRTPIGYPGKIGTKKFRAWAKKNPIP